MSARNKQMPDHLKLMDRNILNSFAVSGRFVDDEVAKGRNLYDVLEEQWATPRGSIWFNLENIRYFSKSVEELYKTSPIPVRMTVDMKLKLDKEARNLNCSRSEVIRFLLHQMLILRGMRQDQQPAQVG